MGQLINLGLYREKKEDSEINRLQTELNELIEDMGGITTGPVIPVYSEDYLFDSLYTLNNPAMWYNFGYLQQNTENEK